LAWITIFLSSLWFAIKVDEFGIHHPMNNYYSLMLLCYYFIDEIIELNSSS
jgi:hypothetical protein